jgi:hypothetical protein
MSEPAGWYTNPDGTNSERYWDGTRWTHEVRPIPTSPLVPPPPTGDSRSTAAGADPAGFSSGGQLPLDVTVAADNSMPAPGPADGGFVPPPPRPSNGDSLGELFSVLFDLSFERPITPGVARWAYLVGLVATVVFMAVMFVLGVQAGGLGAVLSVAIWPLNALLFLVLLRAALQAAVGNPGMGRGDRNGDPARQ